MENYYNLRNIKKREKYRAFVADSIDKAPKLIAMRLSKWEYEVACMLQAERPRSIGVVQL